MAGEKSEPFQIVVACSCKKWLNFSHLQKMAELFTFFFYFSWSFLPSWIWIRIPDPDPMT
jgi:hypothetical protein